MGVIIQQLKKWKRKREFLCLAAGAALYALAELKAAGSGNVENRTLSRNSCGQGEAFYQFLVDGLGEEEGVMVSVTVPERCLSRDEAELVFPEIMSLLQERILGENGSLDFVNQDLNLVRTLPEYGLSVKWESERPEVISSLGAVQQVETERQVFLRAGLSNAVYDTKVEFPVTVVPREVSSIERFIKALEEMVMEYPERPDIRLPETFEGNQLSYHMEDESRNGIFLVLGVAAAACFYLKEKQDRETAKKAREKSLMLDYSELVSGFLVLTGAGYPPGRALKRLLENARKRQNCISPVYEEIEITVNQMETGLSELRAYGEFGRRCGLHCYVKFASLLESSLQTGGKNLRQLLNEEVESAFLQRKELARRQGEEASTKLLFPMFLMLGVVMVMVAAPAFLSFL